jgi:hypothetical protein
VTFLLFLFFVLFSLLKGCIQLMMHFIINCILVLRVCTNLHVMRFGKDLNEYVHCITVCQVCGFMYMRYVWNA